MRKKKKKNSQVLWQWILDNSGPAS